MIHIGCTAFLPALGLPHGERVRRRIGQLAPVFAPALVLAALGCREDAEPPTAPTSEPALEVTAAHTLTFRQVSAGNGHTCGVTTDNVAYCWGLNEDGQLGNRTSSGPETCSADLPCSTRPVRVAGGHAFRQVSAAGFHTCGVTTKNLAYCWGSNSTGELGVGTDTGPETCRSGNSCSTKPMRVVRGLAIRQVSAGEASTCGVTTDNIAYCWGSNAAGELGHGTDFGPEDCGGDEAFPCSTRPVRVAGWHAFRQVSAGGFHICGVTTSSVAYCWGNNSYGELGNGANTGPTCFIFGEPCSVRPVRVVGRLTVADVTAGGRHTCAMTTSSVAYCWGNNEFGQLGNRTSTGPELCFAGDFIPCSTRPVRVARGLAFSRVNAGDEHTCGVTTNSEAYCWGFNHSGELGNGADTGPETCSPFESWSCATRPVRVVGGLAFRGVQAGGHSCAVTTDNVAYCWGPNGFGALGNGTTTDRPRPVAVAAPTP
jgi:alpha-tubulin suppressor-like RCC1 family protein